MRIVGFRSRRMIWLYSGLAVIVMLGVAYRFLGGGGTAYWSTGSGFRGISWGTSSKNTPVSRDRYERIMKRYCKGDLFDWLFVSPREDGKDTVSLTQEGPDIELSVSFLILKEPERFAAFKQSMDKLGYALHSEYRWNKGRGTDLESITLAYHLKTEEAHLLKATDDALNLLNGSDPIELFVDAASSKNAPVQKGLKVVPYRDFIAEVP